MARTAKKKIPIYDEGVLLTEDADSLDFVGAGVTGSVVLNAVTETIAATGAFNKLTATGTVDGSNTIFTFSSAPSIIVVDQGKAMQKTSSDGTVNWTGTTTITLTVAPVFDIYGS